MTAADSAPTPWDLLEASPDVALVVTAQGRIAFANARAETMFGYRRSELEGAPLDMLVAVRSRRRLAEQLAVATSNAAAAAGPLLDLVSLTKDGRQIPTEIAMWPARIADELMVVATIREVTPRNATAAAVLERERLVASIYDTVWDVLFEIALEPGDRFRFAAVNERFCSVTGLRAEQIVGKYVDDVIPEPSLGLVKEKYAKAIRDKRPVRWEEVSDYPTGRLVGEVCVSAVFDPDGRCTRLVGSVHDLTAITSDRMAAVGTLAAGVAHEINNPLAVVIANLDSVSRQLSELAPRLDLPDDLGDKLGDTRECAERIRTIVRDLTLFSRAEEDSRGPVDVESVLESTLRMASNEIRHRAAIVRQYGKVPPALANESRLGQVFLNLVINAAHAIPEGRAELNEIRVSTRLGTSGEVIVEIADTGCGMSPEVQRRLFTPFFTTKPVGAGTGLGLSISHRIVTSLGGTIDVESELEKGSLFRVRLPRAAAGQAVKAPTPEPAAATLTAGRRGRVLVVDDEPALATSITRLLSIQHETFAIGRAQDALDRLAAGERFDVILCDLMMPDMTGMELYDALVRSTPEQAERMVFMTGGAFTARAREFLDRVPNVHFQKPFSPQQLLDLVDSRVR